MAGSVGHECDLVRVAGILGGFAFQNGADLLDDFQIGCFVLAADVVGPAILALLPPT